MVQRINRRCAIALAGLVASIAIAQTRIDIQTQVKRVDLTEAQWTKPFKTGSALPATCSAGEVYLLLTGAPGSNIYTCIAANMWVKQGGGSSLPVAPEAGHVLTAAPDGSPAWSPLSGDLSGGQSSKVIGIQSRPVADAVPEDGDVLTWKDASWQPGRTAGALTVQLDGVTQGSHSMHNYVPGIGILNSASDTGSSLVFQNAVNTAVVQTRANAQSGADLMLSVTSNSGTVFTATMTPMLTGYRDGMVVQFRPNRNCAGDSTLDVDGLGARRLYEASGTAAITCSAGEQFPIWYDTSAGAGAGGWRRQSGGAADAAAAPASSARILEYPGAKCFSGAAATPLSLPVTGAPKAVCAAGVHGNGGALQFEDDGSTVQSAQDAFTITASNVSMDLWWRSAVANESASVVWQLQTACVSAGEDGDVAWNPAQAVTSTADQVTNRWRKASLETVTTTGCAVGEVLRWKLSRDPAHVSDTLNAPAELLSLVWTIR